MNGELELTLGEALWKLINEGGNFTISGEGLITSPFPFDCVITDVPSLNS
jgi:hypothetical protein